MSASQDRAPAPALVLGWLGLLPFPAAAGVFAMGPPQLAGPALLALLTYSAVVLSFLSGVRWGVEITLPAPRWRELALSAVAPAAAWVLLALPFTDPRWQLGGFVGVYLLQWLADTHAPDEIPAWYRRLRTPLTLGAAVALAVALEASISL